MSPPTPADDSPVGAGALVLVVGPSGAGKDSLIAAAKDALEHEPHFIFPRRVVTRTPVAAAEDHDTLSENDFDEAERRGGFMLSWRAHGLAYGIPNSLRAELAANKIVVVNVSRLIIEDAESCCERVTVLSITAPPAILAQRVAQRGRESADEVEKRLRREQPLRSRRADIVEIRNEGPLAQTAEVFINALRAVAAGRDMAKR
jgi:phosphonate metabolism protein PhnN/1,5-bisphosphokinase (PRPP-forming)